MVRLRDVAKLGSGTTPPRAKLARYFGGGTVPWVKTGDLTNGWVRRTDEQLTPLALEECSCKVYPPGTVLLAMYGGFRQIGRTGLLKVPAAINQALTAISLDQRRVHPLFLVEWLNHHVHQWRRYAGSSRKDPNITKADIEQLYVPVPPIRVQRQIVRIASEWNRAIRQTAKLLKLKRRLKRGLMQQLLTGRQRFSEFVGDSWPEVRLRDVAGAICIRNRGKLCRDSVKAVTKSAGMVPMKSELIAGTVERYQIVGPDDFAYNPMRLNIGSIARWRGGSDVLVSPDYVVFRCKDSRLDPDFLDQFRRSHTWSSFVARCGTGSVRVRIWFEDLGAMKIKLPPLPEQRKVAAVLALADREIELLERQLVALREQKKGLMQRLLSSGVQAPNANNKVAK